MASLDRTDLRNILVLLALAMLLSTILKGAIVIGLVGFIIICAIAWLSQSQYCGIIQGSLESAEGEMMLRISVIIVLAGALFGTAILITIGLVIGEVLLFLPQQTFTIDLLHMRVLNMPKKKDTDSSSDKIPKK